MVSVAPDDCPRARPLAGNQEVAEADVGGHPALRRRRGVSLRRAVALPRYLLPAADGRGQFADVDATVVEQGPQRVRAPLYPSERGKGAAATAAELGAERIAGVPQHAVEQVLWRDLR